MVLSKLDNQVSYPEIKNILKADLNKEADMHTVTLNGVKVIIGIGKPQDTFQQQNITYFPVYLVKSNKKVVQIGVYEIPAIDVDKYMNENNELEIDLLDTPLLYSYATSEYLHDMRLIPEDSEDNNSEELSRESQSHNREERNDQPIVLPDERKDIFVITSGMLLPPKLKEETSRNAKDIREKYHESPHDDWIVKFMQNRYYSIENNEGGFDGLFAVIRDAFSSIGQQTTVNKLRRKLSVEVTPTLFHTFKESYDMFKRSLGETTLAIKELKETYDKLKERFQSTMDREEKIILIKEAEKVNTQFNQAKKERKVTATMLKEYNFMENIEDVDELKKFIQSSKYMPDKWALSTLERILNIKLIVLSSEAYRGQDRKNVLQCGVLDDPDLVRNGRFHPDYYIITDFTGDHYKLVGYKKRFIFTFKELPYDMKIMIHEKCLEKNAGSFSLIPELKLFQESLPAKLRGSKVKNDMNDGDEFVDDDLSESRIQGLYDDNIILQYYSKSLDKPLPGKGNGEKISNESLHEFASLITIPQWRKKLSNFWVQPFSLDNHRWNSVEHYIQAAKFKDAYPDFFLSFSLDSGTDLSKDPVLAKAAGSKSGTLQGERLRPVEIVMDSNPNAKQALIKALMAKFLQNEDLKELLLATRNAKLVHYMRGSQPLVSDELMLVRDKLKRAQK